ncbi:hypothetical protein BOX15_Mlig008068g1, partial [Macrostomum lignano]
ADHMVDNCKHVSRIKGCVDLGLLQPERWNCAVCSTTESVWACLHCPNIACGRYNEEHALKHHRDTKHPLSIEVNEKFVFCYVCDDYILNDNAAGDIKILRMALDAVAAQNLSILTNCSLRSRLLRSQAANPRQKAQNLMQADLTYTALMLHRRSRLSWSLSLWHSAMLRRRPETVVKLASALTAASSTTSSSRSSSGAVQSGRFGRASGANTRDPAKTEKSAILILPGTTGLRNLGNTCYMNSVVQILSHTDSLAAYFIDHLTLNGDAGAGRGSAVASQTICKSPSCPAHLACQFGSGNGRKSLRRLTSVECLESVEQQKRQKASKQQQAASSSNSGGLSGGSHQANSVRNSEAIAYAAEDGPTGTLAEELHALFRVLWSGRRAVVSPQGLLTCVWRHVPFFRGYKQQDAQEFLCELLDRLQKELSQAQNIVSRTFQGSYLSTVRCLQCGRCSQTEDIFMDISLAFPESCHTGEQTECQLAELLKLFARETEIEDRSYLCETCNRSPMSQRAKRVPQYSKARQQLRIKRLPRVLRLHLKRFRWIGRAREKICARVCFTSQLDVSCLLPDGESAGEAGGGSNIYHLTGVVVHHGRGFQSGHYTSFCFNKATGSWLHCNDAFVQPSNLDEVLASQAYILFYTQDEQHDLPSTPASTSSGASSSVDRPTKRASTAARPASPPHAVATLNSGSNGPKITTLTVKRRRTGSSTGGSSIGRS